jgi:orotidine-5'-phosphate decarboxylase
LLCGIKAESFISQKMDRNQLFEQIQHKKSFLCVGLDTDAQKIPAFLKEEIDPVFSFNKAIIDATAPYAVAFKPNTAFYEINGSAGWQSLERTIGYIKEQYPEIFVIADAKRGDIGNTSAAYASAFFDHLQADAITVAPYMGKDSVSPFLGFKDKWVVLLALTSNSGAEDFQQLEINDKLLFERVIEKASGWASPDKMMFVVGATQTKFLAKIRQIVPDHFLLVPGIGAQGGDLEAVAKYGMNHQCGLLVNSSRGIIYASSNADFAEAAAKEAGRIQTEMARFIK